MKMMLIVFGTLFVVYYAYTESTQEDLGSPLFLTPYIECGDVVTGREMAHVNTSNAARTRRGHCKLLWVPNSG